MRPHRGQRTFFAALLAGAFVADALVARAGLAAALAVEVFFAPAVATATFFGAPGWAAARPASSGARNRPV